MSKLNSESLNNRAKRIGLEVGSASRQTRMEAANRYEPIPRYEVAPIGNQRADGKEGFVKLSHVAEYLDQREVMSDLRADAESRPVRGYGAAERCPSKVKKPKS